MIEALFSQPNYLAAKKTLDAVVLRQEAIANNIANLETPGYKRIDVSASFNEQLQTALTKEDAGELYSIIGHVEGLAGRRTATLPKVTRTEIGFRFWSTEAIGALNRMRPVSASIS